MKLGFGSMSSQLIVIQIVSHSWTDFYHGGCINLLTELEEKAICELILIITMNSDEILQVNQLKV